jgi:hypothetical protein
MGGSCAANYSPRETTQELPEYTAIGKNTALPKDSAREKKGTTKTFGSRKNTLLKYSARKKYDAAQIVVSLFARDS